MGPIPVKQPRFNQPKAVMMLDDAEMALSMIDIAGSTAIRDKRVQTAAAKKSAELLTELAGAASMIMDREECEALLRELHLLHAHPAAA